MVFAFGRDRPTIERYIVAAADAYKPHLAPKTDVIATPEAGAGGWRTATSVVIQIRATDAPGGWGIQRIHYEIGGDAARSGIFSNGGGLITIAGEGKYTLRVWSEGVGGNVESPQDIAINIDRTPPTISFSGDGRSYAVYEQVDVSCHVEDAISGLDQNTCEGAHGVAAFLGLGDHTLNVTATDRAGNIATAKASYSVVIPTALPITGGVVIILLLGIVWRLRSRTATPPPPNVPSA